MSEENLPDPTTFGVFETLDPHEPVHQEKLKTLEKDTLEAMDWLVKKASVDQQIVASNPSIFNILCGLRPESMESKATASVFTEIAESEPFKGKFIILRETTRREKYSLFNVTRVKKVVLDHKNEFAPLEKIDVEHGNVELIDSIIQTFGQSSVYDQDFLYGLLSGFPLKAVRAWCEAFKGGNVDFQYEKSDLPATKRSQLKSIPEDVLEVHEPNLLPHYRYSPVLSSSGKFPPRMGVSGLYGSGFRFATGEQNDPELQELISQSNFVYQVLGAGRLLPEVKSKAINTWHDQQSLLSKFRSILPH